MKIEAVIVCVDYSDFLCWSLLANAHSFDRLVVVTSTRDKRTRDLCEHHHIECVQTDAFYAGEKAFAKSEGINAGLKRLSCSDWVVHLDADIILPPRLRNMLTLADLDPECIYGIDRLMCTSFDDWTKHCATPEIQHSNEIFVQGNAFPLGVRVARLLQDGYCPIGFFQLWNAGKTGRKTYPGHGEADRSDMRFARQWPRRKRHIIPEVFAIHLESEGAENMGTNWRGRRSPPFVKCYG